MKVFSTSIKKKIGQSSLLGVSDWSWIFLFSQMMWMLTSPIEGTKIDG
jgi:hypothetical protein